MGRKTKTHSWHCGLLAGAAPQLFARRDWAKRRGFFFQGEANEGGHKLNAPSVTAGRFRCNPVANPSESMALYLC